MAVAHTRAGAGGGARLRALVPSERFAEAITEAGLDVEALLWGPDSPEPAPQADLLITARPTSPENFPRVGEIDGLRHVHLNSLGYEWVVPQLPESVTLSNAKGAVEDATAELTLALILAALREIPLAVEQHRDELWSGTYFSDSLHGARVLILGYGGVGTAVARRLAGFAPAAITAVASRARIDDDGTAIHGVDELQELLPEADVVIVTLPHSPATEGLVDAGFLGAMRDGALLVNVGRGKVVNTAALVAELSTERLRAALDVTDPEPLPAGHPLWSAPGCLITPHVGGNTHQFGRLAIAQAVEQARRLAAGLEPLNLVEL